MAEKGFAAGMLPDAIKESLCYDLLTEFGVDRISANPRTGELVHGCLVSGYHQDQARNPTASLNYRKLTYNCLGCQAHGGLLWFIATMRKCSTSDAYKWMEDTSGIAPTSVDLDMLLAIISESYNPTRMTTDIIPTYSERTLDPWLVHRHPMLLDGDAEFGIPGWHIREENLNLMKVGWDPEEDRIVIPHFWKDKLVGWQGRRIWKFQGPKYKSTPDFPKDQTLYNFDPRKRYDHVVVMESPRSVLSKVHLQVEMSKPTVFAGTFGAEITKQQIQLLARAERVIWFLDPDEAGWKAMVGTEDNPGVVTRLMPYTQNFTVKNPWDADPADLSDDDFLSLVSDPVPSVVWKCPRGYLRDYEVG